MNGKRTYEITIKIDEQDIENIAQDILDQTSDDLGDNGLPRTKETFELVLNAAIKKIENYLIQA